MAKQITPLAKQNDDLITSCHRIRKDQKKEQKNAKVRHPKWTYSKMVETGLDVLFILEKWYIADPTDAGNPLRDYFAELFAQSANGK